MRQIQKASPRLSEQELRVILSHIPLLRVSPYVFSPSVPVDVVDSEVISQDANMSLANADRREAIWQSVPTSRQWLASVKAHLCHQTHLIKSNFIFLALSLSCT